MSPRDVLRRVEAATVRLPERGCRGVLVPGGLILTAMHCIGWDGSAGWVLGDYHPVDVEAGGRKFRLGPCYADAVSDMAALEPLDNQVFPDDKDVFNEWRERTPPVPLSPWIPRPLTLRFRPGGVPIRPEPVPLPVHLLSLRAEWERGKVLYWGCFPCAGCVAIEPEKTIESGTSGGPVVDDRGRLVGVISDGGVIPLARLALPGWIMVRIEGTAKERLKSRPPGRRVGR